MPPESQPANELPNEGQTVSPIREPKRTTTRSSWASRTLTALPPLLITTGVLVRLLPLVQGARLLVRQPTEDGYLMLTVARNMAIGLGMSSAAGTMPTNGVQPLSAFIDAFCFLLAGGDKIRGVGLVMALSVVVAVLSLVAVHRLAKVVLAEIPGGARLATLAASLWFAGPLVSEHSMNALETGLYFFVVALVLRYFFIHAASPTRDLPWSKAVTLGALLGLAFWTRNDAIFLMLALGLCRVALALGQPVRVLSRRVSEVALFGVVAAAIAAPWMIFNLTHFGSIVPVSGRSERAEVFAENLPLLPAKLFEYLTVTGAVPHGLEPRPLVQVACSLVVIGAVIIAVVIFRRARATRPEESRRPVVRAAIALGLVHGAFLAVYYGVVFGAPHFLSRYLSPLSILMSMFSVAVVMSALGRLRRPHWPERLAIGMALLAMFLDRRLYFIKHEHMHFQVVDWVKDHVPEQTWVGAIQTGTLGFFHDRTINLDGKTNPAALAARGETKMRAYLLTTPIRYLADWEGIAAWVSFMAPEFRVVLHDEDENIAVLERVR